MNIRKEDYKSLNFEDYFKICSSDYRHYDMPYKPAEYTSVDYYVGKHKFTADYQVRLDFNRKCIQVIMQQTSSKSDWRVNFRFPKKIYDRFVDPETGKMIQLKAHGGWVIMYNAIKHDIRNTVRKYLEERPTWNIEIFGWSLGSALAQMAAEDIYFNFNEKPYLYTFGSVKPFYGRKTASYLNKCCETCYNFYDCNDIVGYMVPGYFAINHIKVELDKFSLFKLFKPKTYHTCYYENYIYYKIK